jgi:hypothetical protein
LPDVVELVATGRVFKHRFKRQPDKLEGAPYLHPLVSPFRTTARLLAAVGAAVGADGLSVSKPALWVMTVLPGVPAAAAVVAVGQTLLTSPLAALEGCRQPLVAGVLSTGRLVVQELRLLLALLALLEVRRVALVRVQTAAGATGVVAGIGVSLAQLGLLSPALAALAARQGKPCLGTQT